MREPLLFQGGSARLTEPCSAFAPARWWLLFLLLFPLTANANPVSIDPISLVAFCVVVFWAFIVESGLVALILAFRGMMVLRVFFCYYVANALTFFLIFQPTLESRCMPVFLLESIIVLIDASAIKFLSNQEWLQSEDYHELSWRGAVIISAVGNTLSYLVGYIASQRPWELEM
jgi:hypothetical protein